MNPKRLVLFVEGQGDVKAAPILVRRLLREHDHQDTLVVDKEPPFRVNSRRNLLKSKQPAGKNKAPRAENNWQRWLTQAARRPNLGAVLLLLDGDDKGGFCAAQAARELAKLARNSESRAGDRFSVAIVFACQEYETWLIGGIESLSETACPSGDLEKSPRDAKGFLKKALPSGYRETRDQGPLTRNVDLAMIRGRELRSFARLEHALRQLVDAVRHDAPTVTPDRG